MILSQCHPLQVSCCVYLHASLPIRAPRTQCSSFHGQSALFTSVCYPLPIFPSKHVQRKLRSRTAAHSCKG